MPTRSQRDRHPRDCAGNQPSGVGHCLGCPAAGSGRLHHAGDEPSGRVAAAGNPGSSACRAQAFRSNTGPARRAPSWRRPNDHAPGPDRRPAQGQARAHPARPGGKRGKSPGKQVQHALTIGTVGTEFRHFPASDCGTIRANAKSARTFAPLTPGDASVLTLTDDSRPVSSECPQRCGGRAKAGKLPLGPEH
jgi:hypothetical protein